MLPGCIHASARNNENLPEFMTSASLTVSQKSAIEGQDHGSELIQRLG